MSMTDSSSSSRKAKSSCRRPWPGLCQLGLGAPKGLRRCQLSGRHNFLGLHVDGRRGKHPQLHQERYDVAEVAIGDVQGGEQSADSQGHQGDQAGAHAKYSDGVLELTLPKAATESSTKKRISVH